MNVGMRRLDEKRRAGATATCRAGSAIIFHQTSIRRVNGFGMMRHGRSLTLIFCTACMGTRLWQLDLPLHRV